MKSTYRSRPVAPAVTADVGAVVLAVVGVLAIGNILTNRLLPDWVYVPFNLALAALVLVLGRRLVTFEQIGLERWRRGLLVGGVVAAATLALFVLAALVPATHDLFEDRRVDGGVPRLLYETLIRIPFGTVLLEEVAFRGVLPAVLALRLGGLRAVVAASALFGLWHVLPAWKIGDVNPVAADLLGDGGLGQLTGITFAAAGTFLAGLWLCYLRIRSGSLLAPVIAHVASNSFAYAIAFAVTR